MSQYDKTTAEIELMAKTAQPVTGVVSNLEWILYPFTDIVDRSVHLASACRARVTTPTAR